MKDSGQTEAGGNFTPDAAKFLSDEALVAGAKMGHGSFFEELHERHRERMFRVAWRITRHHDNNAGIYRIFPTVRMSSSSLRE